MEVELGLLIAAAAGSWASALGVGLLAWRLRPRSGKPGDPYVIAVPAGPHEHEYTHNPGDGYFYCAAEGCDARKRLG